MTIKHPTASTFVFGRFADGWRLALVEHPRFGRWMVPGGHVEEDETAEEAAHREVAEESGLLVELVAAPAARLPVGFPGRSVAVPWWIVEQDVPPDGHGPEQHVHVDHQYVAVATSTEPISDPAHPVGWYGLDDLDGLPMFDDTRMLARVLFAQVEQLTGYTAAAV